MKQEFPIIAQYLGLVPYAQALALMLDLRAQRLEGALTDHLVFLEHPPVITTGRRMAFDDLRMAPEAIAQNGIELLETDRGGKLTYHGPGQLIGYFIFDIQARGLSIEEFVWKVEEGIRLTFKEYGVVGERDPKNPGIWIGKKKIASLGFHVQKGVTTHGIALNVDMDLKPFSYFIPCGVEGSFVTSLFLETQRKPGLIEVGEKLARHYADIFKTALQWE